MKRFLYSLIGLSFSLLSMAQLPMHGWKMHTAYNNVTRVEMASDRVYALSEGALFSVDKEERSISYYNRLTGLSSTDIADMYYDVSRDMLIIVYTNGYIDLLDNDGEVTTVSDLYGASISYSKEVNHIFVDGNKAYLSMDFGILVLNLQRKEIADTYYIGENASALNVAATAVMGDSIYAAVSDQIYVAAMQDNLVDYSCWKIREKVPATGNIQSVVAFEDKLYVMIAGNVYVDNGVWEKVNLNNDNILRIRVSGSRLLAMGEAGTWMVDGKQEVQLLGVYTGAPDAVYDNLTNTGWFAYYANGVGYFDFSTLQFADYLPDGPITNTAYRMRFQGERLYVVPGGYLGVFNNTPGSAMIYERGKWLNFSPEYFSSHITFTNASTKQTQDHCDIIADPADPSHFFVASLGYGLMEFRKDTFYMRYMPDNSGIEPMVNTPWEKYTWIDGFAYDPLGNLWMANVSKDDNNVKVLTYDGQLIPYNHEIFNVSTRIKNTLIDQNNSNIKYVVGAYIKASISVLDDNGTIDYFNDDKTKAWGEFIDEDGNSIMPDYIHSVALDKNGALWAGTEAGVLKFSQPHNLLKSNLCSRVKIARTDGSGLADYMLGDEQINAIAVDGANRIWFGTASSGAYLMDLSDPQDIVTVQHYTTDNSPLPSNNILSIAINPITGEVFFGTGGGLVSYQSDAAEGKENYTGAYAYPNPIRENFDGVITIAGLMKNTQVRITDNGGNLVYETKSNGGIAIWDGKNGQGQRVSSGVYFAMCVTADGVNKTLVKILVMN